ncbi:MAG: GNAT family N-acetyltransferase [Clostridia bacterium]|nr:GNAT family N-acetyltransferase [Clostridia bacterium]
MKITIAEINKEETLKYAELKIQIWKDCYQHILPDTYLDNISVEHKALKYKKELLTDPEVAYYFIIVSNIPIGILRLKYYENSVKEKCVCIKDLYFLSPYQNKGYGGWVFEFIKKEAFKNKCHFITAYVLEKNQSARTLVAKLGFKETTNKHIHHKTMTTAIEYSFALHD